MKKLFKKTKGLVKGTPVAVLVSIGIHGVLLFAALGWVVFTVVKKDEVAFVPVEKLDRPKMKLRKLRVKVKQNSKPKQSTQRIVTKATRVISDIQLPEMSGVGEGLGDSIGGFSLMDDLSKMSLMGGGKSVGNDLVGTYYYLKQKRNGTPSGLSGQSGAADSGGAYMQLLQEFFKKGWDDSVFDPYWRAPTKLYATQMFVPPVPSTIAPEKFGDTRGYDAMLWLAHYKGQIAYPTGGRFRFWGLADDTLFVRIAGKTVLDACWASERDEFNSGWRPTAEEDKKYQIAHATFRVGDWFEMKPGEPVDMEILVGERPGGTFTAMLCVQQEGVEYPEREMGGPLLPIFKTAPTPQHLIDEMSYTLPEGHVDFYGGPIFSVY